MTCPEQHVPRGLLSVAAYVDQCLVKAADQGLRRSDIRAFRVVLDPCVLPLIATRPAMELRTNEAALLLMRMQASGVDDRTLRTTRRALVLILGYAEHDGLSQDLGSDDLWEAEAS